MTLGDADFRKSLMKMIYRKLSKTASLPVTCHHAFIGELDLDNHRGQIRTTTTALRLIDREFNRKAKPNTIEGRAGMTLAK